MSKTRIAVLISGNGSNLQALIEAAKLPDYPAEISLVVSNKPNAYGLKRAENAGIKNIVIDHTQYDTRAAFDLAVDNVLIEHHIEFVCLAGFMRVLSEAFVEKWAGRMINIHPSLLPKYKGLNTHQRVLDDGETAHGCSVHWVSAQVDEGEVVAQSSLEILPTDTADILQARVHALEHPLYVRALKQVLDAGFSSAS